MAPGSLHEVRCKNGVQDAPATNRFEQCLWGAGMRTNLNRIWAWMFVAAVGLTGCSSSKPFAKVPPQMPPGAPGMNPTLNNNTNNAMAKGAWNQRGGQNPNPLAIPGQPNGTGNAAPVIPANGMNGMNATGMNSNQPPAMPGGMTTPPGMPNNAPPVQPTNYQMPPQPPAPLNQSNAAAPPMGVVPTAGHRLPDSISKSSMPIPVTMPESTTTANMLPQPVPPAMDVPPAAPMMPSMSPMPKPAGLPTPQSLAPPAPLPPVSAVPPAPTPLPVRAKPQE